MTDSKNNSHQNSEKTPPPSELPEEKEIEEKTGQNNNEKNAAEKTEPPVEKEGKPAKKDKKPKHPAFKILFFAIIFLLMLFLLYTIIEKRKLEIEKSKIEVEAEKAYSLLSTVFKNKAKVYAKEKNWLMVKLFAAHSLLYQVTAQKYLDKEEKAWAIDIDLPEAYQDWVLKHNIPIAGNYKIYSVCFSPDGNYLAAGCEDMTIKIWNLTNGMHLTNSLKGHASYVESLSFSPDGKYLASGGWDKQIKVWNFQTKEEFRKLTEHSDTVYSVAFSPDNKYLASASGDGTIKLWQFPYREEFNTFAAHTRAVSSVSFSPNGKYLASGSQDNTVKLWQVPNENENPTLNKNEIKTFKGHTRPVTSVNFSPGGKWLASGSWDNTVRVWKVGRDIGEQIETPALTLTGHKGYVESITFTYSTDKWYLYLFSGSADDTIKIWEIPQGNEIATLTGHTGSVYTIDISRHGRYLASGSWDNTIRLWEVSHVNELEKLIKYSTKKPEERKLTREDWKQELIEYETQTGYRLDGITPIPLGVNNKTLVKTTTAGQQ